MKFVFFLKSRLLFNIFYYFCTFVNKYFIYLECVYLRIKKPHNARHSAYYFHVKTKIMVDFHICVSVPLRCGLVKPWSAEEHLWTISKEKLQTYYRKLKYRKLSFVMDTKENTTVTTFVNLIACLQYVLLIKLPALCNYWPNQMDNLLFCGYNFLRI